MQFPVSTGSVARLLGVTEPRINELVRRRRLADPPPIRAGRRLWQREHILQAAAALGLPTTGIEAHLDAGETPTPQA